MTACNVYKKSPASGYSLLETLLSLALASVLLLVGSFLVQAVSQRASWWITLSEMIMVRQAVMESISSLGKQVCQPGLMLGGVDSWRWHMDKNGSCQPYDIRFNVNKMQLQKRRAGGRYTGFIDAVSSPKVTYGVAHNNHCNPIRWLPSVSEQIALHVVILRLQFAVGIQAPSPLYGLPSTWWQEQQSDKSKPSWLWQPTEMFIRLPCVAAGVD